MLLDAGKVLCVVGLVVVCLSFSILGSMPLTYTSTLYIASWIGVIVGLALLAVGFLFLYIVDSSERKVMKVDYSACLR